MSTEKIPTTKKTHVKIVRHIEAVDSAQSKSRDSFHHISQGVSSKLGSPTAFALAVLLIIAWIATGPFFGFSDTWQLVINTTTTIVTFLMVFAIQNTQNRDAKAMQLKLDELIKSTSTARTEFVDIEDLTDTELDLLHGEFKIIHDKFRDKTGTK
jgi:low affinity Fe/Cu permease